MAVQLDHTIVAVKDREESATFLTEILDLPAPAPVGPFLAVEIAHGLTLDFAQSAHDVTPQHYAFRVSAAEFDAIFDRVTTRGLDYWADPYRNRPGEVRVHGDRRGFYFEDPSGHFLEVIG